MMRIRRSSLSFHQITMLTFTFTMGFIATGMIHADPAPSTDPRPTMRSVFNEMKILIPFSLDEARWSAPESRQEIIASLDRLERAADALERHGRSREAGFNELALNLARDFREVRQHYGAGEFDAARFFLTGSLQNCVSCHIRLPYSKSFPLADQLLDRAEVQRLPPREKAWLYVTVRRFEDALISWEAMMRDPSTPPTQLDANGVLVDFLNVTLRVRTDIPRAQREIGRFALRSDIPLYLKLRLTEWLRALQSLDAKQFRPTEAPSLRLGVTLAEKAGTVSKGPFGRDGLIQDLAASSQLVRWLEADRLRRAKITKNPTSAERLATAEAYYWLGIVETRSFDGFWVSLSERHFESAVRSDPKGPFAERAYARLEEAQVLGYGGAGGNNLPADIWTNLKELRELIGID